MKKISLADAWRQVVLLLLIFSLLRTSASSDSHFIGATILLEHSLYTQPRTTSTSIGEARCHRRLLDVIHRALARRHGVHDAREKPIPSHCRDDVRALERAQNRSIRIADGEMHVASLVLTNNLAESNRLVAQSPQVV